MEIRTDERGNLDAIWLSVDFRTHERGLSDVRIMSVDNLPFFAPEQAQSGKFSTLIFVGCSVPAVRR